MKIARVFPTKTKASPDDDLAFFDAPGLFPPEVDEVHISVLFSYDLARAEWLEKQWSGIAPIKIGGPALGETPGEFEPGKYVKHGYVITSRGCPNQCWFCNVWKYEGKKMRELKINDGNNLLDSNLLACSDSHIKAVFEMLKQQKKPVEFTGGLEAKRFKQWHAEEISKMNLSQMFFAYDTPDDLEPLIEAGKILDQYNLDIRKKRCYVLIGYKKDTFENAEKRMWEVVDAGFLPMAMLYRDRLGLYDKQWRRFQRLWCRPAATIEIIKSRRK